MLIRFFLLPVFVTILAAGSPISLSFAASPASSPALQSAGKPVSHLILGQAAPEISALTPASEPATLASLRDQSKTPLVLQFGSITDPIFRAHTPAVEKLAQKFAGRVTFILLYQREAHAADSPDALELNGQDADGAFNLAQPLTIDERINLAQQTLARLHILHQTLLVDAWNNTSGLRYGSYPNMTFIIDARGILQAGYAWMDPPKVQGALEALLAGKPIPQDLQGSVKLSYAAPLDFTGAAMDMTGGRAAPAIAAALDRMTLSDSQKMILYPALAEYLACLQQFRSTLAAVPGRAGRAGPPPAPNATTASAKIATPADAQAANDTLHNAANKLKSSVHQTLSAKDAANLFDALEQSQSQHLFASP